VSLASLLLGSGAGVEGEGEEGEEIETEPQVEANAQPSAPEEEKQVSQSPAAAASVLSTSLPLGSPLAGVVEGEDEESGTTERQKRVLTWKSRRSCTARSFNRQGSTSAGLKPESSANSDWVS
jgi:hypothetical protein